MKAIALVPGTTTVRLVDRPEPSVSAPDEIQLRILRVGICGTDREEAAGGRAQAPPGQNDLVIGHEMFGRVLQVGAGVTRVKAGDYAVFTVRRGCGRCLPCAMNRSDMCETGDYVERGIWKRDGYQAEFAVDKQQYLVRVPEEMAGIGVLAEPMSVAAKALEETVRLQTARLPDSSATPQWLTGRRCLVAGLGPIGLLAALALRLRGAEVYGMDVVDRGSARPQWLEAIGGHYVDGRQVTTSQLAGQAGEMDLILEATGIAQLEFSLLEALAVNGAYVLTGIPGGDRPLQLAGAALIRSLVLKNQVMLGSVNAGPGHFQIAVDDLAEGRRRWPGHVEKLITQAHPYTEFADVLAHHGPDEIKVVLEWPAN